MREEGLFGGRWPVPLRPLPDELLSSWLVRLADAHGLKLRTFCSLVWPGTVMWSRDVDRGGNDAVLSTLIRRTGVAPEVAGETVLTSYEGILAETVNLTGKSRWILSVGVRGQMHRRYGLQFCATCLARDRVPYFRRSWRLACSTVCPEHRLTLQDRCTRCGSPVAFHRVDLLRRNTLATDPLYLCWKCGADLREVAVHQDPWPASPADVHVQHALRAALAVGRVEVAGRPVYSHLFFAGLRQLVRVLCGRSTGIRLTAAICARYGEKKPELTERPKQDIELLGVRERRDLIRLAMRLISDWPVGILDICRAERIWSSTLLRDLRNPPYWYDSVVRAHLYAPTGEISDEEREWKLMARIRRRRGRGSRRSSPD